MTGYGGSIYSSWKETDSENKLDTYTIDEFNAKVLGTSVDT